VLYRLILALEKFVIIHAEPLLKPTDLVHSGMVCIKIFGRVKGVTPDGAQSQRSKANRSYDSPNVLARADEVIK
jgi:hypothetical protein